jgi:hypothetical protein
MSHEDHKTKGKPASKSAVSKRKKGDPEDAIRLSTLRWWALSIEKTSMETFTTNPETFLKIRKVLATAQRDIRKLLHAEATATRQAPSPAPSPSPQLMSSEGAVCDIDQDCGDPGLECCEGLCVPKGACNIA